MKRIIRLYLPDAKSLDVIASIEEIHKAMERPWYKRKRLLVLMGLNTPKYFYVDPSTIRSFTVNTKAEEEWKRKNR